MDKAKELINKYFQQALEKGNSPETREWLRGKLDRLFGVMDKANIPRPVDYNVTISDEGNLTIFFGQEYTGDKTR